MAKNDPSPSHPLKEWLHYYRDLGFTHVYRRAAGSRESVAEFADEESAGERMPNPRSMTAEASSRPSVPDSAISALPIAGIEQTGLFAPERKQETLDQIREVLGDCRRCRLCEGRKSIVFGSGNPKAGLVFVGEGPGADEDEQGLPFVGRAGQLLTDMIEKGMKIPRPDVYICNIVKCRPPGNRKPERDEVAACREFVERQIESIRPRVICALGATAAETILGSRESMGRLRGRWHQFRGIPVMVTYHPAFLLRDPSRKAETWSDLKLILAQLGSSSSDSD
jgi:DNA polymerase